MLENVGVMLELAITEFRFITLILIYDSMYGFNILSIFMLTAPLV